MCWDPHEHHLLPSISQTWVVVQCVPMVPGWPHSLLENVDRESLQMAVYLQIHFPSTVVLIQLHITPPHTHSNSLTLSYWPRSGNWESPLRPLLSLLDPSVKSWTWSSAVFSCFISTRVFCSIQSGLAGHNTVGQNRFVLLCPPLPTHPVLSPNKPPRPYVWLYGWLSSCRPRFIQ